MIDFSFIILTLNKSLLARRCVESIFRTSSVSVEVILLDQGSDKKHYEELQKIDDKRLKLIEGKYNRFISEGRNYAFQNVSGRYTFFCCEENVFPSLWDRKILDRFEETNCDALAPTVIEHKGATSFVRYSGAVIEEGRIKDTNCGLSPDKAKHKEGTVDILPGGALVVKTSVYDKLRFDNKFLFGVEDYDWCIRAKREGLKLYNCPSVILMHDRSGTTQEIAKLEGHRIKSDSARLLFFRWKRILYNLPRDPGFKKLLLKDYDKSMPEEEYIKIKTLERFPDEVG